MDGQHRTSGRPGPGAIARDLTSSFARATSSRPMVVSDRTVERSRVAMQVRWRALLGSVVVGTLAMASLRCRTSPERPPPPSATVEVQAASLTGRSVGILPEPEPASPFRSIIDGIGVYRSERKDSEGRNTVWLVARVDLARVHLSMCVPSHDRLEKSMAAPRSPGGQWRFFRARWYAIIRAARVGRQAARRLASAARAPGLW